MLGVRDPYAAGTNPRQLSLVMMMVAMAKHLGHRVVAEGVETQAVLSHLRSTGCDEVQGYLFAKPMSASKFETWIVDQLAISFHLQ